MKKWNNKGITLIALVITIIVLLILAAVSISTLTGENGILTKASEAKRETEREAAKEKVQMAVLASYGTDGTIDVNQLNENLAKVEGIEKFRKDITEEKLEKGVTVIVDGYEVTIYGDGTVTVKNEKNEEIENPPTQDYNTARTVKEAIKQGLPYENKTTITDEYGNQVVVPEGFKIAPDSATDVTGGVVIEDATDEPTKGSQFVWIPVGTIYTNVNQTTSKSIELNRYGYGGTSNTDLIAINEEKYGSYYQELETSSYGNTTAKNLGAFKMSATTNSGYYIGRYEARTETERTEGTDDNGLRKVTVKADDYVYDYVTQPQAAKLSREMYGMNKTFTSDLVNSYAWDTALIFIQSFGQNDYAIKHFSNLKGFGKKGTNNLANVSEQDKECNIWDMVSNCKEYTTETSTEHGCAYRRGTQPMGSGQPIVRIDRPYFDAEAYLSFRVMLYF